jgi:hypothetical protein
MIDHVVEIEGPIYSHVLIDRIARAQDFQRSGENVQRIISSVLGRGRILQARVAIAGSLAAGCLARRSPLQAS